MLDALAGGTLAAYVERFRRKVIPDVITLIVVPTVTVLGAGSVTLGVPVAVAGVVSITVDTAATWLLANPIASGRFIVGGLLLPLVKMRLTGDSARSTPPR
ncbi:MAG: hypothetical protein V4737_03645 [Curtobacterium sp.]